MNKYIFLFLSLLCLYGCDRMKYYSWIGPREISSDGGSSVWKPNWKNPCATPVFDAIAIYLYDESEYPGKTISYEEIKEPDQRMPHNEWSIHQEWFEVTGQLNLITFSFSPNTTPYVREVIIHLKNNNKQFFSTISVFQKPNN